LKKYATLSHNMTIDCCDVARLYVMSCHVILVVVVMAEQPQSLAKVEILLGCTLQTGTKLSAYRPNLYTVSQKGANFCL